MNDVDDTLWEHLVAHHGADRARLPAASPARSRRWPVVAGVAVTGIAAAAAATSLTGSGSGSHTRSSAAVPAPPVRARDTAYIIARIKARVAADRHHGSLQLINAYGSTSGVRADGTLVDPRYRVSSGYHYLAPSGAIYWHQQLDNLDGSVRLQEIDRWTPRAGGGYTFTGLLLNPARRTYSRTVSASRGAFQGPSPNLVSSPSQVRRALARRRVRQLGTATLDGRRVIALAVTVPDTPARLDFRLTLYVDATTYQPLRTVSSFHGRLDPEVDDVLPATRVNIARARADAVPARYHRVAREG